MIEAPINLPCGVNLKNRIVKSGLSEALGDLENNPTNELISIFKRWSDGGASLLITGNIIVDRWHLEHAGNFDAIRKKSNSTFSKEASMLAQKEAATQKWDDNNNTRMSTKLDQKL